MVRRVYIETTIPSFYFETRVDAEMVARREWMHLAVASYHRCDFLLTWKCQHLANANKFDHIRRVNTLLGLFVPALVTPLELLGEDDEDES